MHAMDNVKPRSVGAILPGVGVGEQARKARGFRVAQVRRVIGLLRGVDLSQTQLAELLPGAGWQSKISRWEAGTEPKYNDLVLLSRMSGLSIDWILTGDSDAVVTVPPLSVGDVLGEDGQGGADGDVPQLPSGPAPTTDPAAQSVADERATRFAKGFAKARAEEKAGVKPKSRRKRRSA